MRQSSHPTYGFFFRIVLLRPFGRIPVSRYSERKKALADVIGRRVNWTFRYKRTSS